MTALKRFILVLLLLIPLSLYAKTISPLSYGLKDAKTGIERFWILYNTHDNAKKHGWKVTYKGIKELYLEIPQNAKSIPLSDYTDFCGTSFIVLNTKLDDFYLFEWTQELHPIDVPLAMLKEYNFHQLNELKRGDNLLIVEDKNFWIKNRTGHNYSVRRKDVLYLRRGKSKNRTILPYDNSISSPRFWYVRVTNTNKQFKNVTLQRTIDSSVKTYLLKVSNANRVSLSGIKIITPEPIRLNADHAITVENCANISISDIMIERTYSFENKYGYGIVLNNVWNVSLDNIHSDTAWGVFGNNNLNKVQMSNSEVNRFDAHCYARDFYFCKCKFSLVGVPESSFVGDLIYEDCIFRNATLCNSRDDYNAYTHFSITLKRCTVYLDRTHHTLVYLGNVPLEKNERDELKNKYTPNINLFSSTVVLSEDVLYWTLFELGPNTSLMPFDNLGSIKVDGLKIIGGNKRWYAFNKDIESQKGGDISFENIDIYNHSNEFVKRISSENCRDSCEINIRIIND